MRRVAGASSERFAPADNGRRHMPDPKLPDGYRGGNVPLVMEIDDDDDISEDIETGIE